MEKRMNRVLMVVAIVLGCCLFAQEGGAPRPPQGGPNGRPGMPPRNVQQGMMPGGIGGLLSSADDVVILMNRLKKENPDEYARLDQLRQTNHGQFFAEMRKLLPRDNNAMQKMMENERLCRQLAQKIKTCEDEQEKAKLETELRENIVANFDATIEEATSRIEKLQKRIEALKENRADILEARYQAFLQTGRFPRVRTEQDGKPGPRPGRPAPKEGQNPPPPPPPAPQAE